MILKINNEQIFKRTCEVHTYKERKMNKNECKTERHSILIQEKRFLFRYS